MDNKISRQQADRYIRQIAANDRNAVKSLYDGLKDGIFSFAYSMLKNRQMAEDVLQDTFVNIMRFAGSYQPGSNPHAWIYSIVRNCCFTFLKKGQYQLSCGEEPLKLLIVDDNPAADYEDKDAVDSALYCLETTEREIVALYVLAGLKQTEIAQLLSLPYIKVRSKYGYAMKKLKRYYSQRSDRNDQ